jgi:uncharacterized protein (TIRG00374 family)
MKRLLFLLFSLSLLALLLWKAGVWNVLGVLRRSDPSWLALAMVSYLVAYLGRALRFRCLLRQNRGGFGRLAQVVCWHNLCNQLLPARTGELSFVYLVRQRKLDTAVSGLSALLVSRILDVITVLLFLGVALLVQRVDVFGLRPSVFWLLAILIVVAFIGSLRRFSSFLTWLVQKSGPIFRLLRIARLSERLGEAALEFRRMESGGVYGKSFAWALFLWTFQFFTFYALMVSFGVFLSFWRVVIGSAAAALAGFIPSAIGSFGPLEAGWALGFALVGVQLRVGLATGFAMHVVVLGFSTVFAAAALLL